MGTFAKHYQSSINVDFRLQPLRCKPPRRRHQTAFTLIETLCVVGIMLSMLAMVVPALNDVLGSRGRKGAVSILLNTFEQARVAALEQSTNVYVGFADNAIVSAGPNNTEFPFTRFIVFRERIDEIDGATAPRFIALTKWQSLPKGISFKSGTGTVLSTGNLNIAPADRFPAITASAYSMPTLKFTNTGMIETPVGNNLKLFIYEGFWSGNADVFTRATGNSLFERITFSRFTGRAQLDITPAS